MLEIKNMYFKSDSGGNVTDWEIDDINQNSNNVRINFVGDYSNTSIVKLTIKQANNATLPTRYMPLSSEVYDIGGTEYRVYSYRLTQEDTNICLAATGTMQLVFVVEDEAETILTTEPCNLTIVKTNTSKVKTTAVETIDPIASKQNVNRSDINELQEFEANININFDAKVDKTSLAKRLYGTDAEGNQLNGGIGYSESELSTIVLRNPQGRVLDLAAPTDNTHLTNKEYVDDEITQAKTDLIGGASAGYDTLKKIEDKVGAENGIASLDANGKLTNAQIPAITLNKKYVVASEVAMLALAAVEGDWALRTDINESYILTDEPATVLGNWQPLLYNDSVTSVNTKTGNVTLNDNEIDNTSTVTGSKIKDALDTLNTDKANKADEFFIWETTTPTADAFTYDCTLRKNYILTNATEIALTITNATNGFKGYIITDQPLTLPANSTTQADFSYITLDEDTPLYEYEFKCVKIGETMYYKWKRAATQDLGV